MPFESLIDDEIDAILKMPKDDSKNLASTNIPTIDSTDIPCPGCGGPLDDNVECGGYVCYDCDWEWESWEVLDSMRDK